MRFRVSIDYDKCVGCGDCVKSCAYGVLEIIDNIAYPVKLENCKGCKDCSQECEAEAIRVVHI
ncbi:4Fe-4S binding protein [Candidatus Bathyarchaeota archaeon]|nr:4Fe-4S binding protein [Candidatus Bathyarchaeota archaeon]